MSDYSAEARRPFSASLSQNCLSDPSDDLRPEVLATLNLFLHLKKQYKYLLEGTERSDVDSLANGMWRRKRLLAPWQTLNPLGNPYMHRRLVRVSEVHFTKRPNVPNWLNRLTAISMKEDPPEDEQITFYTEEGEGIRGKRISAKPDSKVLMARLATPAGTYRLNDLDETKVDVCKFNARIREMTLLFPHVDFESLPPSN